MKRTLTGTLSAMVAVLLLSSGIALAQGTAPKAAEPKAQAAETLDINSASVDELEKLKGVGPARAAAIVKGRPYRGKDDLVRRKIIPQSVYDEIGDQIIAKQK
ncbi:MAG: helix-hairpin-helix domain-containing protein [Burkholderiales bacterium]|nr:MAG: helix-hairpin-helix domain-containing protein [Burkholderiales bacterium]RPH66250.1 MAG: helix-hairpin-helix domain-containing protein [Burkholderiales bacterium]